MIDCDNCGERLVDAIDENSIVIQGRRYQFRRTTDWIACDRCGATRTVNSLRAEAVARGDLSPPLDEPAEG